MSTVARILLGLPLLPERYCAGFLFNAEVAQFRCFPFEGFDLQRFNISRRVTLTLPVVGGAVHAYPTDWSDRRQRYEAAYAHVDPTAEWLRHEGKRDDITWLRLPDPGVFFPEDPCSNTPSENY